jgi:hypothetical protein
MINTSFEESYARVRRHRASVRTVGAHGGSLSMVELRNTPFRDVVSHHGDRIGMRKRKQDRRVYVCFSTTANAMKDPESERRCGLGDSKALVLSKIPEFRSERRMPRD